MARFSRIDVAQTMIRTGLVPLFYHDDANVATQVMVACYRGGARLLEFTQRGDFAHETFSAMEKHARSHCPEMILGAGSIVDAGTASFFIQSGANFIVSPSLHEDVALICNRRKIFWSAGCGSVKEVVRTEELGCEIVKIFPGDVLGPNFIKAIRGPHPWSRLMPTGGVTTDPGNLIAWFEAGASCVGIGSKLLSKDLIEAGNYRAIEQRVEQVLNIIASCRSGQ